MTMIRERVMRSERVLGAMVFEFFSPGLPQIMFSAGCEYLIYDMEHTGIGFETLRDQVSFCRGLPITPMARVPRGEYHFLARALDIGLRGVMVPMVDSVEKAQAIVAASRYPPLGRRGAAFGFAHDDYLPGYPDEKIRHANDEILVIAQIETERGLDAVEDIAAVEGIDVLWVGHFDLTNFLGEPGGFQSRRYLDALGRIVRAARTHNKGLGFMASDLNWAREYAGYGFNMLAVGPDQALLGNAVGSMLKDFAEL
ncbi:MAG: HpcH/HpaI aldolase/citrate lyase family protein [Paracoccaceae bacterium]